MPRFVILQHDTPTGYERPPHFDLMLEAGEALRTFALPHWPEPGETVNAEQLADHRLAYLDYQGAISGGRGEVTRQEAGQYEIENDTSDTLLVRLRGRRLAGTLLLQRTSNSRQWRATWAARPSDA
jgi:DNA polymerase ligase (LigD)-like protein